MRHLIMWKVDTPGTVEEGTMYHVVSGQCILYHVDSGHKKKCGGGGHLIMWKVDTPGTVDDETMYHEESGHTRNCVGRDYESCGR